MSVRIKKVKQKIKPRFKEDIFSTPVPPRITSEINETENYWSDSKNIITIKINQNLFVKQGKKLVNTENKQKEYKFTRQNLERLITVNLSLLTNLFDTSGVVPQNFNFLEDLTKNIKKIPSNFSVFIKSLILVYQMFLSKEFNAQNSVFYEYINIIENYMNKTEKSKLPNKMIDLTYYEIQRILSEKKKNETYLKQFSDGELIYLTLLLHKFITYTRFLTLLNTVFLPMVMMTTLYVYSEKNETETKEEKNKQPNATETKDKKNKQPNETKEQKNKQPNENEKTNPVDCAFDHVKNLLNSPDTEEGLEISQMLKLILAKLNVYLFEDENSPWMLYSLFKIMKLTKNYSYIEGHDKIEQNLKMSKNKEEFNKYMADSILKYCYTKVDQPLRKSLGVGAGSYDDVFTFEKNIELESIFCMSKMKYVKEISAYMPQNFVQFSMIPYIYVIHLKRETTLLELYTSVLHNIMIKSLPPNEKKITRKMAHTVMTQLFTFVRGIEVKSENTTIFSLDYLKEVFLENPETQDLYNTFFDIIKTNYKDNIDEMMKSIKSQVSFDFLF